LGVSILLGLACDASDDGSRDSGADAASTGEDDAGDDAGQAEDTADEPPPATSFAEQVLPILAVSCSCHRSVAAEAGLDLRDEVAYATLTEGMSLVGVPLVVAMDPDASYFVLKLRGTQGMVGGSGSKMPLGGELDAAQLDVIEAWVAGGAAP
jgi:hypothetical protein